jgi:hypothetical protein
LSFYALYLAFALLLRRDSGVELEKFLKTVQELWTERKNCVSAPMRTPVFASNTACLTGASCVSGNAVSQFVLWRVRSYLEAASLRRSWSGRA